MDLNLLAILVRVIDSGSMTKAAQFLRQPKSRISRRIATLERELGASLIYRTTRQFSPTEAGLALYQSCRDHVYALEGVEHSLSELTREVAGTLKITAPEDLASALLGPLITELNTLHPKLSIELDVSNEVVDLIREGIDLAIRIGEMEVNSLRMRSLGRIAFILVASPDYLRRNPKVSGLADLTKHPTLVFDTGEDPLLWKMKSANQREDSVRVRAKIRSNNLKVLLDLAVAGEGIALIPEYLCLDAIRARKLERILKYFSTEPYPIQIVWPFHRETSPKIRAFVDLGTKRLKKYFER